MIKLNVFRGLRSATGESTATTVLMNLSANVKHDQILSQLYRPIRGVDQEELVKFWK